MAPGWIRCGALRGVGPCRLDVLRTDCACERFCSEFKDIHGDEGSDVPRQLLGAEHLGAAHGVAEAVATLRA